MTARNRQGRFISDREAAAELLLETAVREAIRLLRSPSREVGGIDWWADQARAFHTLKTAEHSADLLLGEAS